MRLNLLEYQNINTEVEYRALDVVSYSLLKVLDEKGPKVLIQEKTKISGDGIDLGTLVDTMLTEPEEVDNKFYGKQIDKPTASLLLLANDLLEDLSKIEFEGDKFSPTTFTYVLNKVDELKLWDRNKKTKVDQWNNQNLIQYLKAVKDSKGKIILSPELYNIGTTMANTLKTHEFTKGYFNNSDPDIEVIYQFKRQEVLNDVKIKYMMDLIVINHRDKTVKPIDLKTGAELNFMKNFYTYKYYLQGGLYSARLNKLLESSGYLVLPFEFVYISRMNPMLPLIFKFNADWVTLAHYGWTNNFNHRVKGIIELVEDYKWYNENFEFKYKRELIENNGVAEIPLPV